MWLILQASLLLAAASGSEDGNCRREEVSMLQAVQTQAALTEMGRKQAQATNVTAGPCSQRMAFERSVHTFPIQNLYWLHIPKAGTSFIATVWNYACGQGKEMLDFTVSDKYAPHCGRCYDYALMERYPKHEYCTQDVLHSRFTTAHNPISTEKMQDMGMHAVAMFRQPNQRIISARNDGYHANGFSKAEFAALRAACGKPHSVECFARYPGIAGCMARMLTGGTCAESSAARSGPFDGGRALVDKATWAVLWDNFFISLLLLIREPIHE